MKITNKAVNEVAAKVQEILGAHYKIERREIRKQNNTVYHGVCIQLINEKTDSCTTSPVYYVEQMFNAGVTDTAQIAKKIVGEYLKSKIAAPSVTKDMFTKKYLLENAFCRMVETKANEEYLKDAIYDDFLDLSAVYVVAVRNAAGYCGSMKVSKALLKQKGITIRDFKKAALDNIRASEPKVISCTAFEEDSPLICLTNKPEYLGANYLLTPDVIREYADMMQSDFYILPSSIHEIMLVPAALNGIGMSPQELKKLVEYENSVLAEGTLTPEEVLSSSVYYYSRTKNEISICV